MKDRTKETIKVIEANNKMLSELLKDTISGDFKDMNSDVIDTNIRAIGVLMESINFNLITLQGFIEMRDNKLIGN